MDFGIEVKIVKGLLTVLENSDKEISEDFRNEGFMNGLKTV